MSKTCEKIFGFPWWLVLLLFAPEYLPEELADRSCPISALSKHFEMTEFDVVAKIYTDCGTNNHEKITWAATWYVINSTADPNVLRYARKVLEDYAVKWV